MTMYRGKVCIFCIFLLSGCKTTEQIAQERYFAASAMDNIDLCYNLGKEDDFEYWKILKSEQFKRIEVDKNWDVPSNVCDRAVALGKDAQLQAALRKQRNRENWSKAINDATKSIADGYSKAATYYTPPLRTTCQTYGSITSCDSY